MIPEKLGFLAPFSASLYFCLLHISVDNFPLPLFLYLLFLSQFSCFLRKYLEMFNPGSTQGANFKTQLDKIVYSLYEILIIAGGSVLSMSLTEM